MAGRNTRGINLPTAPATTPMNRNNLNVISSYFSQSQLALALCIHKSTPADISTINYCQQLSKNIKTSQPTPNEALRCVDTAEFWKDQYSKLYAEKKKLEDKAQCLEELQRLLDPDGDDNPEAVSLKCYIRRIFMNAGPDHHQSKRLSRKRRARCGEANWLQDQDDEIVKLSGYALRIRRQRIQLEKSIKGTETLDQINAIAHQTSLVLAGTEYLLSECCLSLQLHKAATENDRVLQLLQNITNQVTTTFLACFGALNELCNTIPGRSKKGEMVYRMVKFFSKCLNLLHKMSLHQSSHESTAFEHHRDKRARTTGDEYIVNRCLADCLACIAHGLEWKAKQAGHADLLEGILFCILQHTGRLVSEAVFAEHVATSDRPGHITLHEHMASPRSLHSEEVVTWESKYVVQVLRAALGDSRRQFMIAEVLAGREPKASSMSGSGTGLLARARLLMQRTLLQKTVGGDPSECLGPPTPPIDEEMAVPWAEVAGDRYGSEWLVATVWALVGWDLVA